MRFSKLFFALFGGVLLSLSFSSAAFVFKLNINNPGLEDQLSKNYSRIHFNAGGNDFGGTIFRFNQLDPTGDIIEISGDDTSIYCSNQMRGLYHNSQRGDNRLWPLDQATATLLGYDSDLLQVQGGLYTNCDPGIIMGQNFGIYGYLVHNYDGKEYRLLAGVQYDGKENKMIDNSVLRPTLQKIESLDNYPLGFLYDDRGGGIGFLGCRANAGFNLMTALASFGGFSKVFDSDLEEGIPVVNKKTAQEVAREAVAYLTEVKLDPAKYIDIAAEDLGVGEVDVECLDIPPSLFQILFLKIQGIIGTSTSSEKSSFGTIQQALGNETSKTQYFSSVNLNNATLINQANKQAATLCRGKWKNNFDSNENVNCIQLGGGKISLSMQELQGTTLVLKGRDLILKSSKMDISTPPLNIFIDGGKLILETDKEHRQNFDDKGFPVGNKPGVASGVLINGNIVINGLITNESDVDLKYYLHGKFSSLNTYSVPEQPRISQLNALLGEEKYIATGADEKNGEVNLTEVFKWRCSSGTTGTDGSDCSQELDNEFWSSPFNVIDKYYPWILLQ